EPTLKNFPYSLEKTSNYSSNKFFSEKNGMIYIQSRSGETLHMRTKYVQSKQISPETSIFPHVQRCSLTCSFGLHEVTIFGWVENGKVCAPDVQPTIKGREVYFEEWNDFDSLQGTWIGRRLDHSLPVNSLQILNIKAIFDNDKMQILVPGQEIYEGTWWLD